MPSRYRVSLMVICLWHTITVSCLQPEQEDTIRNYLQQKRTDIPHSLPLKFGITDGSIFAGYDLEIDLKQRKTLENLSKYGELIHWEIPVDGNPNNQDREQYISFIEGMKKLSKIAGLEMQEPDDWHVNEGYTGAPEDYTPSDKVYHVGKQIWQGFASIIREAWTEDNKNLVLKAERYSITEGGITEVVKDVPQVDNEYRCYEQIKKYHALDPENDKSVQVQTHLPVVEKNSTGIWTNAIPKTEKKMNYKAMIMERLGTDVGDLFYLCCGLIRTRTILEIIVQTVKALKLIHEAGILHRDIKPGNLLSASANSIKVADFGLSCTYVDDGLRQYRRPNAKFAGTYPYVSKELLEQKLDDLYWVPGFDMKSLGYTLLEFWLGDIDSFYDQISLSNHMRLKTQPMKELCVDCPPEFEAFLDKAEESVNIERTQMIDDMMPDYDNILENLDSFNAKFSNNQIEFDWIRKTKMLFNDPEVSTVSYKSYLRDQNETDKHGETWTSYTRSNYLYVTKFYSDILREAQNNRMKLDTAPLIVDDKLMEDAKNLAKDPEATNKDYTSGTVAYRVHVNSCSLKDIIKELGEHDGVPVNEWSSGKMKYNYKDVVNDGRYLYVGFGLVNVDDANGAGFDFSLILSPELVGCEEGTDEDSVSLDAMRVAFYTVMTRPTHETIWDLDFEDQSSVTRIIKTGLVDEGTVSRAILSEALTKCRLHLLASFPFELREPNTFGYSYRIDNINHCAVVAMTTFKKKFYGGILENLQHMRKDARVMPLTLRQEVECAYNPEDRIWYSAETSYGFHISQDTEISLLEYFNTKLGVPKNIRVFTRSELETGVSSEEEIMDGKTDQERFEEAVHKPTNVFVRIMHYRKTPADPLYLIIKFTSPLVLLKGGQQLESNKEMMEEAENRIIDSLKQEEVPLSEIVENDNAITAIFQFKGDLTIERLQSLIMYGLNAIDVKDVTGETDPCVFGYCYNLERSTVSVSVVRLSHLLSFTNFEQQVVEQVKTVRETKKNRAELRIVRELTEAAQFQSITGIITGGGENGMKTYMATFVVANGVPDIPTIFREFYRTDLPEKVRPKGAKPSRLSRRVFRKFPKFVLTRIPLLGDSFKSTVQDCHYCRCGFAAWYDPKTKSFRMVFKFGLENQKEKPGDLKQKSKA